MTTFQPAVVMDKLAEILETPLASVEILPGDWADWAPSGPSLSPHDTPFLIDSGNLGIPKKVLYRLYGAAMAFANGRGSKDFASAKKFIQTTNVILLANPAHQTALNTRKRLIEQGHLSCEQELRFSAFVLMASPDGSKQSIVWDHRRWLFNRRFLHSSIDIGALSLAVADNLQEASPFPMIPHDSIEAEFKLIRRACTTYPRNYHAWVHWRYLMDAIYLAMAGSMEGCLHFIHLAKEECSRLLRWIESHSSDTSAIHHLCSIRRRFHTLPTLVEAETRSLKDLLSPTAITNHAISLVERYPSHESLWIYTRSCLVGETTNRHLDVFYETEKNHYSSRSLFWLRLSQARSMGNLDSSTVREIMQGDIPERLSELFILSDKINTT